VVPFRIFRMGSA